MLQDEQVTWAQLGPIQCAGNTHLLGELGDAPAMKMLHSRSFLWLFLATNTILSVFSLHVHTNVNNWSLTLAIDFTWAQVNLRGHRPGWVCPGL